MKVAYKWRLDCNNFAYIVDDNGKNEPLIGEERNESSENEIKTFATRLNREQYRDCFNKMVEAVRSENYNINFLDWSYYYDLTNDTCLYRGIQNNASYTATVSSINSGTTPDVKVLFKDGNFDFEFTVVNGKNGKDGKNGENGKDGKDGKDGKNGEGVPNGGQKGQVLAKVGSADYDTSWQTIEFPSLDEYATKTHVSNEIQKAIENIENRLIPSGGIKGQSLVKRSGDSYDIEWSTVKGDSENDFEFIPSYGGTINGNLTVKGEIYLIRNNNTTITPEIASYYEYRSSFPFTQPVMPESYDIDFLMKQGGIIKNGNLYVNGNVHAEKGIFVVDSYDDILGYNTNYISGYDELVNNGVRTNGEIVIDGILILDGGSLIANKFYSVYMEGVEMASPETSDIRLKNVIGNIDIDVEKIINLSIMYFTFKNDSANKQQIGVIAQEIAQICPEIVSKDKDDYLMVDYSKLSLLCLHCIKDLYTKIK